jgi:uncharacterized YigZ family protein
MADPDPWSYLSPLREARAEFKERSSRFIGHVAPVASPEEAAAFHEALRRSYHDASHHCWAYRVGWAEALAERAGDDGEPSRTAGPPILAALTERRVSDACLVVVRYFGGVKLGTGGLARAYRQGARSALDAAELVSRTLCELWEVTCPYPAQGAVRRAADPMGVEWLEESYGEALTLCARVPRGAVRAFEEALGRIAEVHRGGVTWKSK